MNLEDIWIVIITLLSSILVACNGVENPEKFFDGNEELVKVYEENEEEFIEAVMEKNSKDESEADMNIMDNRISSYIYVDKNGDDDNAGGENKPLLTIQEGIDRLEKGQALIIGQGVYNEKLYINKKGDVDNWYYIIASAGASVIVDGEDTGKDNDLVYVENSSFLRIEGIEFRNNSGIKYPTGICVEGAGEYIEIVNNTVHDIHTDHDGHGICFYGTEAGESLSNILIEGNEVYDNTLGSSESVVVNGNVEKFIIRNNYVYDNNNIGIDCIGFEGTASSNDQARNGEVYGNSIYNITSKSNSAYNGEGSAVGIYIDGGTMINVYNNTISNCDIGIEVASESHGDSADFNKIYDNYILYSDLYGIAIGGADSSSGLATDNTIQYNTLFGNKVGIAFQNSYDNLVTNNLIATDKKLIEGDLDSNEVYDNQWYTSKGNNSDLENFIEPEFKDYENGDYTLVNGFNGYGVR